MNFKVAILALTLVGCAYSGESDVLELGDSDFDSKLSALDNVLVMFYAPWFVQIISIGF